MQITDRYGGPQNHPDQTTMCHGLCEGIGRIPVMGGDSDEALRHLWADCHNEAGIHDCNGWHFVVCPDCEGSGKRAR
jgi:hypothetical protein